MALTDEEAARLAALIARRDALIGATAVKKITHGSRSKEMTDGDSDKLQAEIDRLEAQAVTGSRRRRGAITFALRR
jgi:hypothetical protein